MLPKKNRLEKKTIEKIFKNGSFLASNGLTFKYIKSGDNENFKISFIVPKTVSKSAVKRNALRRKGYAVLQKNLSYIPFPVIGAFIFSKKGIEDLENEIKNIFNKIH